MRAPIKIVIVLAIVFACAACFEPRARAGENAQKITRAASPAQIGSAIPQFCLNDLNGRKFCSDQLRGKVLLIDFWASWCGPCKKEMPAYQKFQDAYGPKGLMVIGIGLSMDSSANLKKFARALGVHYKLLAGTMRVQDAFGLKGIPTTLLVDRNGITRARVVGFDYPAKLKPKIQALL